MIAATSIVDVSNPSKCISFHVFLLQVVCMGIACAKCCCAVTMDSSALYVVALHVVRHVFHCSEGSSALVVAIVLFSVFYGLVCSRKRLRRIFGPARPPWEFDLDEIPSWLLLNNVLQLSVRIQLKTDCTFLKWLVENHWDKMHHSFITQDSLEFCSVRHEKFFIPGEAFPIWFDKDNLVKTSVWKNRHSTGSSISLYSNSSKALQECMRHLDLHAAATEQMIWECDFDPAQKFTIVRVMENLFFDDKEMLMRKLQDFRLGCANGEFRRMGVVIHGDSGTGKTALISGLANYLRRDVYDIDISKFSNDLDNIFHKRWARLYHLSRIDCFADATTSLATSKTNPYCEALVTSDERARDHVRCSLGERGFDLPAFMRHWELCQQSGSTVVVTEVDDLSCVHPALLQPGFFDTVIHMRKASHTMLRDIVANVYDEAVELERVQRIPERVWAPSDVIEASLRHPDADSLIEYLESQPTNPMFS